MIFIAFSLGLWYTEQTKSSGGGTRMELNDVYDAQRNLTGREHRRGTPWRPGEFGLVVCVWVYDGRGNHQIGRAHV